MAYDDHLRRAPLHERAWAHPSVGDRRVERLLEQRAAPPVALLHDRRMPRRGGSIDHLAVAPSGVWVIDSKRYSGRVSVSRPMSGRPRLTIAGRDRTSLVEALRRQMQVVERLLDALDEPVPVRGALCFVGADLPLMRTLSFDGCLLARPRTLARRLNATGPLAPDAVGAIARQLAVSLPPAR